MVKIYVDADACPVKDEIERIAARHDLITYMVCNGGIRPSRNPLINLVVVNQESDAADSWIISCLLYTSPSPRDRTRSRMPSSA